MTGRTPQDRGIRAATAPYSEEPSPGGLLQHDWFTGRSGVAQHYLRSRPINGSARGVVLLHGWPGFWYDWRHVLPELAGEHDVVAPDLRGFGRSGLPDGPADQVSGELPLAEDVVDLLVDLEPTSWVVVGTDLGAAVAQRLAREHPEIVDALVLINPSHAGISAEERQQVPLQGEWWYQDLHQQPWAAALIAHDHETLSIYLGHFFRHWVVRPGAVHEIEVARIVAELARPGAFERSLAWYRSRRRDRERALSKTWAPLVTPTKVLWTDSDPVAPVAWSQLLPAAFTDYDLAITANAGHFLPIEDPAVVAAAVRSVW